MKKFGFSQIFMIVSGVWVIIFAIFFFRFWNTSAEIAKIELAAEKIDNLLFYEKNIAALEIEYESVSRQSYTTKSASEFIAKLPTLAENAGIDEMTIEQSGFSAENGMEIHRLSMTAGGDFSDIADFIDILERSKLPIQIEELSMENDGGDVTAAMEMKIYKKTLED